MQRNEMHVACCITRANVERNFELKLSSIDFVIRYKKVNIRNFIFWNL